MSTGQATHSVTDPHPRKITKKGWVLLGILLFAVVAVYTMVVAFYSAEGGSTFTDSDQVPTSGISAVMEPIDVNPDLSVATFRITLASNDKRVENPDGRAADNIRVTVSGPDGSQELLILSGAAFGRAEIEVGISGELAQYPFDTYAGVYFVSADFFDREAGGVNQTREAIPVLVTTRGAVNGWDASFAVEYLPAPDAVVSVGYERAFSTKLFALVLVSLAFIVSLIALVISFLVFSNRRKIEIALLAWSGSLIFALPILRSYLPGAPPIGAAIDIYIFLWAIVMSFVAVFLIVAAWISQTGAALRQEYGSAVESSGDSHGP